MCVCVDVFCYSMWGTCAITVMYMMCSLLDDVKNGVEATANNTVEKIEQNRSVKTLTTQ